MFPAIVRTSESSKVSLFKAVNLRFQTALPLSKRRNTKKIFFTASFYGKHKNLDTFSEKAQRGRLATCADRHSLFVNLSTSFQRELWRHGHAYSNLHPAYRARKFCCGKPIFRFFACTLFRERASSRSVGHLAAITWHKFPEYWICKYENYNIIPCWLIHKLPMCHIILIL